jgi:16S rRNA (adenine1518-N6/adenine1519-N6)-dimethyltransferase
MNHPDHTPRKRFGQNFLHEAGVVARIVRAIDPRPGDRVVEIGPGQGALTFPLLDALGELTAIEIDRDLIPWLREHAPAHGRLTIVESDALEVDLTALAAGGTPIPAGDDGERARLRLVGNLPYNISTPLLFHALAHAAAIRDMHFMLQKEVVDRMAAPPGSKVYGRLSVMLQARCTVEALFRVPAGAFRPPPKVESAIVRLVPRPAADVAHVEHAALDRVVRAAFEQRRKTLHNALKGVADDDAIRAAGVDPGARAEQLDVARFVALAAEVARRVG